jgi:AraC-like DNA-binding protein
VHLREEDVLLLPTGTAHIISDGGGQPARDARAVYRDLCERREPFPGDGPGVRLLSGHFAFDHMAKKLLLPHLPDVLHMSAREDQGPRSRSVLSTLLRDEIEARRPGTEIITERLAEIFLVQTIRDRLPDDKPRRDLLAAVLDPRLSAPIAMIHACYHEPLTLEEIARRTGMSRSSLAEKFKALTSFTPMSYLAAWRMLRARELLGDPTLSIGQIAVACGHRSAEGFSRAYKRAYGISPSSARSAG